MQHILKEWLDMQGRGAATRLSRESGLSNAFISELANGKSGWDIKIGTARALEKGTGIKAAVWLGLEPPHPLRRATDRRKAGAKA